MSFAAIKDVLYPKPPAIILPPGPRETPLIIALLANIDPMIQLPRSKLLAYKEVDEVVSNKDVIEIEWRLALS